MRTVRLMTAALAACLVAAVVIAWGTAASAQGRGAVAGRGAAPQGRGGGPAGDPDTGGGRGSAIQGTVENFVPVSQAELHNPDPGDWLMLGGNTAHWNYSSLDQINRDNVQQLQLVWARQMPTNGGRAGTSPLIHKGVMYLLSPNDVILAVDAATGSRIWEYRRQLPKFGNAAGLIRHRYSGAKRGLVLYGDKIFTVASDNVVIALDARTGKVVWEVSRGGDARATP